MNTTEHLSAPRLRLRGLYAITPEEIDDKRLIAMSEAALQGGASLLQLRDKTSDAGQRLRRANALLALCRRYGACFIVNDDLELALAVNADGVHLGMNDGDLAAARRALPANMILGASCYADFRLAECAVAAGANYVAFGAVCPSSIKPQAVRAQLDLFTRMRDEFARLGVPSCAIGGITLADAPAIMAAGADMLAVISDLFTAPDIRQRAQDYQQFF